MIATFCNRNAPFFSVAFYGIDQAMSRNQCAFGTIFFNWSMRERKSPRMGEVLVLL